MVDGLYEIIWSILMYFRLRTAKLQINHHFQSLLKCEMVKKSMIYRESVGR